MKRFSILLIIICWTNVVLTAQKTITLKADKTSIETVLKAIEQQSEYTFSYNPNVLESIPSVSVDFQEASLSTVLAFLFDHTDIQYIIQEQYVLLKKRQPAPKLRTISGYVYDKESNETLIGAVIIDQRTGRGTVTNNYGFYSLSIPVSVVELQTSFIGYASQAINLKSHDRNETHSVYLEPSAMLETLVVEGDMVSNLQSADMGKITMNASELKSTPSFLGESDLRRTLQLTPGVNAGTEGVAGMYVRGGNLDENLYLVDGNPVYHVNHLLGIFSTFNTDAVKLMNFYKGSFPARFGGRLSSVVEMRMNDGDSKKLSGTVSVGLLASRLNLNGPIIKDRTTFNISVRRTYLDLFSTPLLAIINKQNHFDDNSWEKMKMNYNFYDINGKISHRFSDKSRLFLSIYVGNDKMTGNYTDVNKEDRNNPDEYNKTDYYADSETNNKIKIAWGTQLASLNWAYQFNPKLYSNHTLIFSRYGSTVGSSMSDTYTYSPKPDVQLETRTESLERSALYGSGIMDIGVKTDYDYRPRYNHYIRFGATLVNHYFRPEHTQVKALNNSNGVLLNKEQAYVSDSVNVIETSLYMEDDIDISEKIKLNIGVHISNFNVENKNYFSLQPRISGRYLLKPTLSLKLSYARMNQYLHLLQTTNLTLPSDLWTPITANIKPLVSNQVSGGVYWDYQKLNFSMETYYKTSKNQMEYMDEPELFVSGNNWEKLVAQGKGQAYGIEWMVAKREGNTTGWAGYSLSWATRHFPNGEINNGKPYYAKYDNRHKINIVANHQFNKKIDVSASWFYATGNRITLPLEKYISLNGVEYYTSEKNNYKLPPYHRLDLSVNFTKQKKKGTRIWSISLYNTYFHKNAFMITPENVGYDETYSTEEREQITVYLHKSEYRKISILPIVPSVSYTYKF